jgi:hypothetical protein
MYSHSSGFPQRLRASALRGFAFSKVGWALCAHAVFVECKFKPDAWAQVPTLLNSVPLCLGG